MRGRGAPMPHSGGGGGQQAPPGKGLWHGLNFSKKTGSAKERKQLKTVAVEERCYRAGENISFRAKVLTELWKDAKNGIVPRPLEEREQFTIQIPEGRWNSGYSSRFRETALALRNAKESAAMINRRAQ